jgi:hypothetical protein
MGNCCAATKPKNEMKLEKRDRSKAYETPAKPMEAPKMEEKTIEPVPKTDEPQKPDPTPLVSPRKDNS